jgi:hypothetical protein
MEDEFNYLDLVKNHFDFVTFGEIATILYRTHNNLDVSFTENGKEYVIDRRKYSDKYADNNRLTISCSDGRKMSIVLGNDYIYKFSAKVSHSLNDGASVLLHIKLEEIIDPNTKEESFDGNSLFDKVCNSQLLLYQHYYKTFEFVGTDIIKNTRYCPSLTLSFTKRGVLVSDRYLLSDDCTKILLIDNKPAPTREEIENYSIKKEKEEYKRVINNSNLDPLTKKELIKNFNITEAHDYYGSLIYMYNESLPFYRNIIDRSSIIIGDETGNYMFSPNEMRRFVRILKGQLFSELEKYSEEHKKKNILKRVLNRH